MDNTKLLSFKRAVREIRDKANDILHALEAESVPVTAPLMDV